MDWAETSIRATRLAARPWDENTPSNMTAASADTNIFRIKQPPDTRP